MQTLLTTGHPESGMMARKICILVSRSLSAAAFLLVCAIFLSGTANAQSQSPVNTVPGALTTDEDTPLPIPGLGVADADTSQISTTLSLTIGTMRFVANGNTFNLRTVTLVGTPAQINTVLATIVYNPTADFNGPDTLTMVSNDRTGAAPDTDTVVITVLPVNDDPIANDDNFTTNEDTALNGDVFADNGNGADSDPEGDTLSATISSATSNGIVDLDSNGSFTYTPNPNFNGLDNFTYVASDGNGGTASATVNITVDPVNDSPVNTVPGTLTTDEDTPLPIPGLGVADADTSQISTTLSLTIGTMRFVANGNTFNLRTVTLVGTPAQINTVLATIVYNPTADFNGPDTLTMVSNDGALTDTDTVVITVGDNEAPVIVCPADQDLNANTSGQASLPDYTGLAVVTDNADPNPTIDQSPLVGTSVGLGGSVVTLTATDAAGNTASCGFTVTVVDNELPTAVPTAIPTLQEWGIILLAALLVLVSACYLPKRRAG